MKNDYEQLLKGFPKGLAEKIENSDAFQQAQLFVKQCKEQNVPIEGLKFSRFEVKVSFSLQSSIPCETNYNIQIPEEIYNC